MLFSVCTWSSQLPSDRINCVPWCRKQDSFPFNDDVTVEVTDEEAVLEADVETLDVAVENSALIVVMVEVIVLDADVVSVV